MKFEKDPDIVQWLSTITISKNSFQWDLGNQDKNKKHSVTKEEIEAIFESPFVLAGKIIEPFHPENRWILLGQTLQKRKLTLIFTIRDNHIRAISCRSMRKKEKNIYEETIKG